MVRKGKTASRPSDDKPTVGNRVPGHPMTWGELVQRYHIDTRFHQLISQLEGACLAGDFTLEDYDDALYLTKILVKRERERRRG